jgi:hypothetical protein
VTRRLAHAGLVTASVIAVGVLPAAAATAAPTGPQRSAMGKIRLSALSSGARTWWSPPTATEESPKASRAAVAFGTNVDANDPSKDFGSGQSETAIAASGDHVMAAWNDISGAMYLPTTDPQGSVTGVGYSSDGGRSFTDLIGLANNNPYQQWYGDPTVVAVDANTFIIGGLYYPSLAADCAKAPQLLEAAVEVATVGANNQVSFSEPVVVASGGDYCGLINDPDNPPPDLAQPDKEWLAYDPATRTVAVSYTRFYFGDAGQSGDGQVELVRAHLPASARTLSSADFAGPTVVWPEEATVVNTGAYAAVSATGDTYVAWERNIDTNLSNGDPYVYIHAAKVPAGAGAPTVGGPASPVVVTAGQQNSSAAGGVKSLDGTSISGYSRGLGNDFPRIALDPALGRVVFAWNDASLHPLGDIFLRTLDMSLASPTAIAKVNDDSSYALHFLPAVSVRSNGAIVTSWYDRRRGGPQSTLTDYYAEVRSRPTTSASDVRISTGQSDWTGVSSLINPNFGDYTDNTSSGNRTYFTWSDGRIGVPQPFVDRR